jgi:hypothetical protein
MSESFKLCVSCTPRYQRPISLKMRQCPVCGARGLHVFREPTPIEARLHRERIANRERFLQQLIKD